MYIIVRNNFVQIHQLILVHILSSVTVSTPLPKKNKSLGRKKQE